MPAAWVAAVAAIYGAYNSSQASKDASNAQVKASDASIAEQRRQYDLARSDFAPYRATGLAANQRLAAMLGLGSSVAAPAQPAAPQATTAPPSYNGKPIRMWEKAMGFAQDGDVTTVDSGPFAGRYMVKQTQPDGSDGWEVLPADWKPPAGNQAAAPAQPAATGAPTGGILPPDLPAAASPADAGVTAAATAQAPASAAPFSSIDSPLLRKFSVNDLDADPVFRTGLAFGINQGSDAINSRAIATGNYDSGATLKALTRYANDYGNSKANESYNRYTQDQTNVYNKLAAVSGTGQVATQQVAAAGTNAANQISGDLVGAGNARAAGIVGSANAWGGAASNVSGAYNNYQQNQRYQALYGNQQPSGYGYSRAGGGSDGYGTGQADYNAGYY